MQDEKQQRKMDEGQMLAAISRSLRLQSMGQVEGYFTTARGFFMEEGNAGYKQFKLTVPARRCPRGVRALAVNTSQRALFTNWRRFLRPG